MRGRRTLVAIAFLPLASGACHRAKPDPCTVSCKLRATEIGCAHPELCEAQCGKLLHAAHCGPELRAFMECFIHEPKERWECNDEGLPIMLGFVCADQQASVSDCMDKSGGKL
jgi:hypothetical protein